MEGRGKHRPGQRTQTATIQATEGDLCAVQRKKFYPGSFIRVVILVHERVYVAPGSSPLPLAQPAI